MLGCLDTTFPDYHWKLAPNLVLKRGASDLNELGMLQRSHLSQMRSFDYTADVRSSECQAVCDSTVCTM